MSRLAGGERGAVLAALMVMIAILGIVMAGRIQDLAFMARREKEKELVFRGQSIARAIQRYTKATNGYPTSIEQLMKVKPPVLRSAYPDPMTARYDRDGKLEKGTGEWTKITFGQEPTLPGTGGGKARPGDPTGATGPTGASGGDVEDDPRTRPLGGGRTPDIVPFVGVRSRSEEESIGRYMEFEPPALYSEWRFQAVVTAHGIAGNEGGIEPLYPPGFGGMRAPGGPPWTSGPARPRAPRPAGQRPIR